MSVKGDNDRTGDHKKAGVSYTRIFGAEAEVRERRRQWIEEQQQKKAEGDIRFFSTEVPDPSFQEMLKQIRYNAEECG